LTRKSIRESIGDHAIEDSWKVTKTGANTVLVSPGEAWVSGFPFSMRGGQDQLVSGSSLALGSVITGGATNITCADDPTGLGKIITFNSGGTTPAGNYQIVISAIEAVITNITDPFLKNANISESTAQKLRTTYRINIVPVSSQSVQSIPYKDSTGDGNLVNYLEVIPQTGLNGSVVSTTILSGSEQIDGRNIEIIVRNNAAGSNPLYSGTPVGNPFPTSNLEQQEFSNGVFVDSLGKSYHLNVIFNDVVANQLVIRLDKEPGQLNPTIIDGSPYKLYKKDVFVTDDSTGTPQGQLFWPIANIDFSGSTISHDSKVVDLRKSVSTLQAYEDKSAIKFNLKLHGGGTTTAELGAIPGLLTWTAGFSILNPSGLVQTIAASEAALLDGGSLAYLMNLTSGGAIAVGNQSVTSTTTGTSISLSGSPDLSTVKVGNTFRVGTESVAITAINNTTKVLVVSPSISVSGAGTIYKDTYAAGTLPVDSDWFILATKSGTIIQISDRDSLSPGESSDVEFRLEPLDIIKHETALNKVRVSASDILQADGMSLSQELISFFIDFDGSVINFTTGAVLKSDDSTALGLNFTPASIPSGEYLWYGIGAIPNTPTGLNELSIQLQVTAAGSSNAVQASAPLPILVGSKKLGAVLVHNNAGSIEVVDIRRITQGGGSGSGAGFIKVHLYNPISTTLPTGISPTIDGITLLENDLVLFTNLSSNNNRIYKASNVLTSTTWTLQRLFENSNETPVIGDAVRATKGTLYSGQVIYFDNSSSWVINDTVRLFDGANGSDFWELGSIKTVTLADNTVLGDVFSVAVSGSENWTINYSLNRGAGLKETGIIYITSDGTITSTSVSNANLASVGVDFSSTILTGNLKLQYTTTNTGTPVTMKLWTARWSDAPGGPSGVPSYTGSGGVTPAAGATNDVQYKGTSGNLDANTNFKFDPTELAINLNGLYVGRLEGPYTLTDNTVSPTTVYTFADTVKAAIIEYNITRDGNAQTGRLMIANTGSVVNISDDFISTASLGITFSVDLGSGLVRIKYVTTSTTFNASMKLSVRKWS
jgi:hypothetical protein